MNAIIKYLRAENDPEIVKTGPSSLTAADKLGKGLGWLGLALGAAQLFAGRRIADAMGLDGKLGLLRLSGARDIGAAMMTLSPDRRFGLWGRVGGDVMNVMLAATALGAPHPQPASERAACIGGDGRHRASRRDRGAFRIGRTEPHRQTTQFRQPKWLSAWRRGRTRRCKRFHHPARYACRVRRGALGWRRNNGVEPDGQ